MESPGMGKKDRKTKKRKPPPRRKPRPDVFSQLEASSDKQRGPYDDATESSRLLRRLRSLRFVAGDDEHPADVAVCQPQKSDQLDPAWAADVEVVREALELVYSGKDDQARDIVRRIPRRSPLSQWRLFLAGLSDWYAGDAEQAEASWQRLDLSRRPARIAAVLRKVGRSPARAGETTTATASDAPSAAASPLDEATLESRAGLVRSLRLERPALGELATATSRKARRGEGEKFPFPLVDWIISWRDTYGAYEPELVAAAQRNALALAYSQPEAPVFERLVKNVPGPPHDPKNRLYLSQYFDKFVGAEEEAEKCRRDYLRQDLPRCEELSKSTRAAVESLLHLEDARELQAPPAPGILSLMMGPPDNSEAEQAYKAAIKAYPTNRAAHREYVELLRREGYPDRDTKKDEEARNRRIRRVMERWSKSLPEDVEPRLWLVNHYLENEELKSAQPHVEMLQRQRLQDPRVRTLPWRWALFETMRLARHKRRVDQAREQLDQAESLWPEWLSKTWIPYLRAALAWRAGETEASERLRDEADASVDRCPLLSNVMALAAARRMHIPSAALKPLRQTVTDLINDAQNIDIVDLLKTGCFLWDLDRTEMFYTGYRTHGPRLIQELSFRFADPKQKLPDELLGPAALWAAGARFASDTYDLTIPALINSRKTSDPLVAAAALRAVAGARAPRRFAARERATFDFLKSAAGSARDPFYRHYFQTLTDDLAEYMSPTAVEAARFGQLDDEEDDDWDEGDWDDEEELCYCDNCRRKRGELVDDEEELEGPGAAFELPDPAVEVMQQMFEEVVGMLSPDQFESLRQQLLFDDPDRDMDAAAAKVNKKSKRKR